MSEDTKVSSGLQGVTMLESPTDYFRYRREMEDYISVLGYENLLPGESKEDEPVEIADMLTGADLYKAQEVWKVAQQKIKGCIRSRCGENAREIIKEYEAALREESKISTVADIWKLIEEKFRPTGSSAFQDLLFKWENTTLATEGTVTALAAKLRSIRSDLKELDESCYLGEPFLMMRFFSALGEDYAAFVSTFLQTNHLITVKKSTGGKLVRGTNFQMALMKAQQEE
ncbi:hypothetical protein EV127DRAFT_329906, partial [Xylaria flabelliformis]